MAGKKPGGCLLLLGWIAKLVAPDEGKTPTGDAELPYQRKESLLTPAELSFYHCLKQTVGNKLDIFAQVRVADVLEVTADRSKRQSFFNRISGKHFDFLLCHPKTSMIILAIELDDSSHKRKDRKERDSFLNQACEDANLVLLRFPVAPSYDVKELKTSLQEGINQSKQISQPD